MATGIENRLESIAQDLFHVMTRVSLATQPIERRDNDLKDMEFLTLSILHSKQPMIVGDIQKILGVLPAQMSRIIRALENRELPLIACQINAYDKRKIDVRLTDEGEKMLNEYQHIRVERLSKLLAHTKSDDQQEIQNLLNRLQKVLKS